MPQECSVRFRYRPMVVCLFFLMVSGCQLILEDIDDPGDEFSPHAGILKQVPQGTFQRDLTTSSQSSVSAFRISRHEITRAQWKAVTGWPDPSDTLYSGGEDDPVQKVSWYDAIAFCNKLSLREGLSPVYYVSGVDFTTLSYNQIPVFEDADWNAATANHSANGYRLPTEMEWMWAAMGADRDKPGIVNTTGWAKPFAGSDWTNMIGDYAVFGFASTETGRTLDERTTPVGSKMSNELGIRDLSGNVSEWVWDWHGEYPDGTLSDARGPMTGTLRVLRGGNWHDDSHSCSVSARGYAPPHDRKFNVGFRVVRR